MTVAGGPSRQTDIEGYRATPPFKVHAAPPPQAPP